MKRFCTLTVCFLGVSACDLGSDAPSVVCTTPFQLAGLSPAELRAYHHSEAAAAPRCGPGAFQCGYKIRRTSDGGISINVDFVSLDDAGRCVQAPGDYQLQVYSASGIFKDRVPGI